MLEKPACRRAAQDLREDRGPPLRTMANVAAKRVAVTPPGSRRAGCPHPAGPRGGANVSILKSPWCGGRERPPYVAGRTLRLTGNPCAAATSVGDDACIVPGALRRCKVPRADMESAPTAEGRAGGQPGNHIPPPRRKPCRGRCSHRPGRPCAAANTRGRAMALPYRPQHTPGRNTAACVRHCGIKKVSTCLFYPFGYN